MKLELNQDEIKAAIIEKAVDEILGDHDQIYDLINSEAHKRITKAIGERVNSEVEAAINTIMEQALDSEIHPVNTWGESAGKPTTVRAALHERAKDFWSEKVDKDGKSGAYNCRPRYEHVLSVITAKEFDSAVKQNIVNIAGSVKDAVRKDFYDAVDAQLNGFFKINSQVDQDRKKSK